VVLYSLSHQEIKPLLKDLNSTARNRTL
jgi:hypothetical protein